MDADVEAQVAYEAEINELLRQELQVGGQYRRRDLELNRRDQKVDD